MQSQENLKCPVCGRPNRLQDQCTFCGANLQDVAPSSEESPSTTDAAPTTGPGPSYGPSQPWEGPALTPKFAGFWIRAVAYTIDGFVIVLLLSMLIGIGLFGYSSGSGTDTMNSFTYSFDESVFSYLNLAVFALYMAYYTFFIGTRGQTLGKMICGLKVLRVDGGPVGFGQAAIRTLGYFLNHFTLYIGFLWVAIDPRKQGLHDKIAGTVEIRVGLAEVKDWQTPPPMGT